MTDKKYRCTLPFSHLNIASRGVVTPCCNYEWRNNPAWQGADKDYTKFTWVQEGLSNILESKIWFDLRKKSQKNIPDAGCSNCYFSDEASGTSRRTWANHTFPDADKQTKLLSLELKLGAKCNLECRTCGHTSSNKLLKESSYSQFGKIDKDWIRRIQGFSDWTKDENFWNDLKSVSNNLEYIQFTGGEPLLIQEQYEYLQWLADNNIYPTIQYITNATQSLDEFKRKLWDNFPNMIMDFSIDGVGQIGEYVRTGSVWNEQAKNISEYVEYFKERNEKFNGGSSLNLATTVSILNVTEIKPVLDFMYDVGMQDSSWSINIVRHEYWMDVANLKGDAKEYALDAVNQIINDNTYSKEHRDRLEDVIQRLNAEPTTTAMFTERMERKERIHNTVNKNRHHDFSKLLPDWWDMLIQSGN